MRNRLKTSKWRTSQVMMMRSVSLSSRANSASDCGGMREAHHLIMNFMAQVGVSVLCNKRLSCIEILALGLSWKKMSFGSRRKRRDTNNGASGEQKRRGLESHGQEKWRVWSALGTSVASINDKDHRPRRENDVDLRPKKKSFRRPSSDQKNQLCCGLRCSGKSEVASRDRVSHCCRTNNTRQAPDEAYHTVCVSLYNSTFRFFLTCSRSSPLKLQRKSDALVLLNDGANETLYSDTK